MLRLALPILALFLSLILLVVGNGMLGTLLAIRLDLEGFDTGVAGLILAQYAVGFVIGSSGASLALFVLVPLFVGLAAALYPVCLAFTHDHLDHTQIVPASSTLLLVFGTGTIVGPIGSAYVMGMIGPPGLFLFTAVALAVLTVAAVLFVRTRMELPVGEQEHCVTVAPVSTPAIVELDPRNLEFGEEDGEETQRG